MSWIAYRRGFDCFGIEVEGRVIARRLGGGLPTSGRVLFRASDPGDARLFGRVLARHELDQRTWGTASWDGRVDWRVRRPICLLGPEQMPRRGRVGDVLAAALPAEMLVRLSIAGSAERALDASVAAALELDFEVDPRLRTDALSPANRRALSLVEAALRNHEALFLDDVSAGLDTAGTETVAAVIRRIAETRLVFDTGEHRALDAVGVIGLHDGAATMLDSVDELVGWRASVEDIAAPPPEPPPWFEWIVPGRLAGMPRPGTREPLDETLGHLSTLGITDVVTLEESHHNAAAIEAAGLRTHFFPIVDMTAPEVAPTRAFAAGLGARLAADGVLAIHCKAGIGRTGTLLAVLLIDAGHTSAEAVAFLRQLNPRYIQTRGQLDFVHAYHSEAP